MDDKKSVLQQSAAQRPLRDFIFGDKCARCDGTPALGPGGVEYLCKTVEKVQRCELSKGTWGIAVTKQPDRSVV